MKKNAPTQTLVNDVRHSESRLFPPRLDSCELTIACHGSDFSASRIARAVEDVDAHLLNMNVTADILPAGEVAVDLRVSHRDGGSVAHSLERYGFRVTAMYNAIDRHDDTIRERIDELMAHLEV